MYKWFGRFLTGLAFSTTVIPAVSGAAVGVQTGHADMLDAGDKVASQERGGVDDEGGIGSSGVTRGGTISRLQQETYDYEVIRLWAMMGL